MTLVLSSVQNGQGQSLPSAQQLQQLQQQYANQSQQNNSAPPQSLPPAVILQPAVPIDPRNALPPSRLEQILSQRAGARLQQFGYDQLGRGSSVEVPQTGAMQDDYVLGPGDEIVVSLCGQENNEFRAIVDRNGQVVLPRLNPIPASGRSFGSFREDVQAAVHRGFVATEASVSVGRVRQVSVTVAGEVNSPGQRIVTGLSSAVDALLLSGGVKKTGSLRAVKIQRNGHVYTVDLYNVLTASGSGGAMRLADGDRILVPPLGRTVAVTGLVRRPGIFELAPGQSAISVKTLLNLAGGQEVRGQYRLSVLRLSPEGASNMMPVEGQATQLHDSEILFVQLGADHTTSQATLSGGTGLAGAYPVVTGTRLSQVIKSPGALGDSPYTAFGVIVRKDPATLMPMLLAFTPAAVLAGREDQTLQSGDVIRVISTGENQLLSFVVGAYLDGLSEQQNAIRNPLNQKNDAQNSLNNVLASRSGQTQQLSSVVAVPAGVQRDQITKLLNIAAPGTRLAQRQAEAAQRQTEASQGAAAGLAQQQRGGTGYLPPSAQGAGTAYVPQIGPADPEELDRMAAQGLNQQAVGPLANAQPGAQPNNQPNVQGYGLNSAASNQDQDPARNFTDEAVESGRFATNREVQTFGQFARQLNIDPLILVNFLVDNRVRLDGAVRGPGYYFVGPNTSLAEVVQVAGGTVSWADESGVELITTAVDRQTGRAASQRATLPLRQGTLASYIVRPGDQVRFGQVFSDVGIGSVTVQGEVRFAGTFTIMRGERLSELMARAGGLTNVAYPYGTVFLRQSAAQVEREGYTRAANEVQNQLVIAMTRIGNDKIDPATFASMQTFVSELRNQQALGRISIVADPSVLASNPAQDPLLEPGDVIYIPQRPSTISVLGQVLQPGSYPYKPGESLGDYIARAGGYASTADESQTFVVLPDGSARRIERSWLSFRAENLPPGSAIVVPRDVTPLDLRQTIIDVSQIFSQFAVAIASVAVLSRQ